MWRPVPSTDSRAMKLLHHLDNKQDGNSLQMGATEVQSRAQNKSQTQTFQDPYLL